MAGLLDSCLQLIFVQTVEEHLCPAVSCCVQRPAVIEQGSELITRAGSSTGWMYGVKEVDSSEVVSTVQQ